MNSVLGGWQLTVINTGTSGLPTNITYTLPSGSGLYVSDLVTYRPIVTNGAQVKAPESNRAKTPTSLTGFLNRSLVTNVAATAASAPSLIAPNNVPGYADSWGNMSRNSVRSYAFFQTDLGVHKDFPLWREGTNLDFRAESFNLLNHVNYGALDGNISNSTFGTITSNYPARQLQLAGKIIF